MRDAIELHLLAQHGEEWANSLDRLFHRLHRFFRRAVAGLLTERFRRAG